MDSNDRLVLALVLVDVAVIVMVGFAGSLVDLAHPGRRWTRRRMSARSVALFATVVLGFAYMVILPITLLVAGFPSTIVSNTFMGPWILTLGAALSFAISRKVDKRADTRLPR